jgi:hypothetical protein
MDDLLDGPFEVERVRPGIERRELEGDIGRTGGSRGLMCEEVDETEVARPVCSSFRFRDNCLAQQVQADKRSVLLELLDRRERVAGVGPGNELPRKGADR